MPETKHNYFNYVLYFLLILLIFSFKYSIAKVSGESMSPTFKNSNLLLVDKLSYIKSHPKYGDIIVFNTSNGEKLVKRVIGVPGDAILLKDNTVYRNEIAIDEPYLKDVNTEGFLKITVPEKEYFVLGDNRNESIDSRFESVGTIPFHKIIGEVNSCIKK